MKSLKDFYYERIKASSDCKTSCPGEKECLKKGNKNIYTIGSSKGEYEGRTLENYCHGEKEETNDKRKGCPLFPTKPENVPDHLLLPIESAERLKGYKEDGILNNFLPDITAWEYTCLQALENASAKVTNEMYNPTVEDEVNDKQRNPHGLGKGGGFFETAPVSEPET